jgi:two-component system NtrC family sensor kinase
MSDDSEFAYIKIKNGGPKIPSENKEKIFESFFTTKPVGMGTGLGLAISRKIIVKMGGTLILDETADSPTFIIKVPLKEEDSELTEAA